ncbi:MAG: hypothetical protein WCT46_03620 [Candidatus Gracilibacteria bacterium]
MNCTKAVGSDGRKTTLAFTLTEGSHYVPEEIKDVLIPELFETRLHPYDPINLV